MPREPPEDSTVAEQSVTSAMATAWKSVYGFLVATLFLLLTGTAFLVEGGVFAPLTDASAVLVGAFLAPVVSAMGVLTRASRWSRAAVWLGLAAVVTIAVGSFGLLAGELVDLGTAGGSFLRIQLLGLGLQGAWLVAVGVVGHRTEAVSRRVSWAAVVGGLGYGAGIAALSVTMALSLGYANPAVLVTWPVAIGGVTLWGVWLGAELRSRARETTSAAVVGAEGRDGSGL